MTNSDEGAMRSAGNAERIVVPAQDLNGESRV